MLSRVIFLELQRVLIEYRPPSEKVCVVKGDISRATESTNNNICRARESTDSVQTCLLEGLLTIFLHLCCYVDYSVNLATSLLLPRTVLPRLS